MSMLNAWMPGPDQPSLEEGAFHVWRFFIPEPGAGDAAGWMAMLSAEEIARAERLAIESPRRRFIFARAALRGLLARYTGSAPRDLALLSGPHGKPRLADSPLSFNMSHAGNMVLIALTHNREVGVDIERIDATRAADAIACRFFSPAEQAALAARPDTDRVAAFFRIWSRKEAVIKALGEGLTCPLDSFDVSIEVDEARLLAFRRDGVIAGSWSMHAIDAHPGYAAAAAVMGGCDTVRGYDGD